MQNYLPTSSKSFSLQRLRLLLLVGGGLMVSFIIADLTIIPEGVHQVYFISRLGMQLPILAVFFALTFLPFYARIHHQVLCLTILGFCYANYWLIVQCWQIAAFPFPDDGTLLYGLFGMFILRLSFKYSLLFVFLALLGFGALVLIYPVYGQFGLVDFGFLSFGLGISLIGVKQIETAFSQVEQVNEQLLHLSQTDPLTGLFNRGSFEQNFDRMLAIGTRTHTTISVFMVDLDNFKDFNDGFGHMRGDEVIRLQAAILREVFNRETDMVARYGGEEFVVISLGNSPAECEALAERILQSWRLKKVKHGKGKGQRYVSCSIGLVNVLVTKDTKKKQLFEEADKAMYGAKDSGRAMFVNASKPING
jgi:diguanylate cyclase (GGDEF)-like protein